MESKRKTPIQDDDRLADLNTRPDPDVELPGPPKDPSDDPRLDERQEQLKAKNPGVLPTYGPDRDGVPDVLVSMPANVVKQGEGPSAVYVWIAPGGSLPPGVPATAVLGSLGGSGGGGIMAKAETYNGIIRNFEQQLHNAKNEKGAEDVLHPGSAAVAAAAIAMPRPKPGNVFSDKPETPEPE